MRSASTYKVNFQGNTAAVILKATIKPLTGPSFLPNTLVTIADSVYKGILQFFPQGQTESTKWDFSSLSMHALTDTKP